MLLAIDIGNTNITLGVFRPGASRPPKPAAVWRLSTRHYATPDEYGLQISGLLAQARLDARRVSGVCVASVVPPLDGPFQELSRRFFGATPLFIDAAVSGVRVLYENPAEVGADRLVNAVAGFSRLKRSCIVADFGTAATFDCVGGRGEYLGGVIAPGPQMAAEALAQRTAKLPLMGAFRKPRSAIGRTTLDSLGSGLYHGYVGLTEGILRRLKDEMGPNTPVLATGGLAPLLAPSVKDIREVLPDLTLEGLKILWDEKRS